MGRHPQRYCARHVLVPCPNCFSCQAGPSPFARRFASDRLPYLPNPGHLGTCPGSEELFMAPPPVTWCWLSVPCDSLASVPLALHYLSKERFALWALMAGIGGYLSLIDLGMSSSVARLLIDHKDSPAGGTYGGLIKTGWLVLLAQGGIVFLAGFGLAPAICKLLAIQPDLQREFIQLLRWQSISWALSFGLRIFSHLLIAHQRIDIYNYSQAAGVGLSFALLWFFFHAGQGVFSLVWSGLVGSFVGPVILFLACWHLKLFPPAGAWGRASWRDFQEIFGYGKDLFLVGVGTQLIMASQTMIITRQLGLEAAAAWSIGTKAFTMVSQAVWRVFDVSGPAVAEMMARGEHAALRERYRAMVVSTVSLSALAAVLYAGCNSLFVTVWTHHKIAWPPLNDVLLAAWMIVSAVVHCHCCFVLMTKQIGFMRYVYFVEGVIFVTAALVTVRWGGLPAMIICSITCSILFSGAYGVWRVSRYFNLSLREVGWRWLAPATKVLVSFAPLALAGWWALNGLDRRCFAWRSNALVGGSAGFYLFLRYGLPPGSQAELMGAPPGIRPPAPACVRGHRLGPRLWLEPPPIPWRNIRWTGCPAHCGAPSHAPGVLHTLMLEASLAQCRPFVRGNLLDVGCGRRPYEKTFFAGVKRYIGTDYLSDRSIPMSSPPRCKFPLPPIRSTRWSAPKSWNTCRIPSGPCGRCGACSSRAAS